MMSRARDAAVVGRKAGEAATHAGAEILPPFSLPSESDQVPQRWRRLGPRRCSRRRFPKEPRVHGLPADPYGRF